MNNRNITSHSIYVFFVIGSFILINIACADDKPTQRKSETWLNPDCGKYRCNDHGINIIYIKASSQGDVLHYLIAGGNITKTLSAIIIRSTDLSSSVSINWDNLFASNSFTNDSIVLNGKNFTSFFGVVFTKLYTYQDDNNVVEMPGSNLRQYSFDEFQWNTIAPLTPGQTVFTFQSNRLTSATSRNDLFANNGSIIIEISYTTTTGPSQHMPRLIFNSNNTQFNVTLNNLYVDGTKTRFAVQLALFNGINNGTMFVDPVQSIDDETSPGVFRYKNFKGQDKSVGLVNQTYVQWKPVCYTKLADTSLNSISVARDYPPKRLQDEDENIRNTTSAVIRSSIAYMLFKDTMFAKGGSMSLINVTFGIAGDNFYENKYITWSVSFGYGTPPITSISLTIIMVLIFGLGLPFVFIVFGSIYVVVKKKLAKNQPNAYNSIGESIN